jgi:hypothetical protein
MGNFNSKKTPQRVLPQQSVKFSLLLNGTKQWPPLMTSYYICDTQDSGTLLTQVGSGAQESEKTIITLTPKNHSKHHPQDCHASCRLVNAEDESKPPVDRGFCAGCVDGYSTWS